MMRRKKTKIVYHDDGLVKVLFGDIVSEDDYFISVQTQDGVLFRINKRHVVSIREGDKHE
jgi:hypothetical protein